MSEPSGRSPSSKASRNERRKALAATIGAIGIAVMITTFLQPMVGGSGEVRIAVAGTAVFLVSQILAHYILDLIED